MEHLLQAEDADRAMRFIAHQMKSARFPMHRDLAGFDFEVSQVDQVLVHKLADLSFTLDAQNVVLVGGPGTGKTRVIVHRVAYLVRVRRVAPDRIIALAFNRSAALELRRRLKALVGEDAYGITVMTYHALALRLTGTSLSAAGQSGVEVDFGRLLADAVALLEGSGEAWGESDDVRDRLLQGYEYIFVDEYQDIDEQQYALISALAGRRRADADARLSIMAVGDDDQNIYSFKGANVGFIRRFQADYGGEVTYLVENFRSTQKLIAAANHVIQRSRDRMKVDHPIRIDSRRAGDPPGGPWPDPHEETQGRVKLVSAPVSPNLQAQLVLHEIDRIRRLDPTLPLSGIAVLARTHRALEPVRAACEHAGLRYQLLSPEANAARVPLMQSRQGWRVASLLRHRPGLVSLRALQRWTAGRLRASPDDPYWQDVAAALQEFADQASAGRIPASELLDWLYEAGNENRRGGGQHDALRLMTAHGAKGLEFAHVIVMDCGDWQWKGEDERRLLYVAMTRARAGLVVMRAEDGRNLCLVDLPSVNGVLHVLPPVRPQALSALDRRYQPLGPAEVDLGFSGRLAPQDAVHSRIAALGVADRLMLRGRVLEAGPGRAVGRLAARTVVEKPDAMAVVTGVMVRTRARTDPRYAESIRNDAWEVVLAELIIEPPGRPLG